MNTKQNRYEQIVSALFHGVAVSSERFLSVCRRFTPADLTALQAELSREREKLAALSTELTGELYREFFPPIEATDLLHLSHLLHDLFSVSAECGALLAAFCPRMVPRELAVLAAPFAEGCRALTPAAQALFHLKDHETPLPFPAQARTAAAAAPARYTAAVQALGTRGDALIALYLPLYGTLLRGSHLCTAMADLIDEVVLKYL